MLSKSVRRAFEWASRGVILKRSLPQDLGGSRLYVTPEARLAFWKWNISTTDPSLFDRARELVSAGSIVWDVGANVGLFSFAASALAGASGRVFAIEPDQLLVSLLRRSLGSMVKQHASVDILPFAISNSVDLQRFCIAQRSRASNYLSVAGLSETGGCREEYLVMTVTLDWLLLRLPPPTILKIDVEGAEHLVLEGAQEVLSLYKPVVLCEVSEPNISSVTRVLKTNGYSLFDADLPISSRSESSSATWNTLAIAGLR